MALDTKIHTYCIYIHTSKSSIIIGVSILNHPFWGTPMYGNPHKYVHIACAYINPILDLYQLNRTSSSLNIYKSSHEENTQWTLLTFHLQAGFPPPFQPPDLGSSHRRRPGPSSSSIEPPPSVSSSLKKDQASQTSKP